MCQVLPRTIRTSVGTPPVLALARVTPSWTPPRALRLATGGLQQVAVVVIMLACLGDLTISNPIWPQRWRVS